MVLAMALDADVAQQHHLVIAIGFFEGAAQDFLGIFAIAGEELLIGPHDARRCVDQPFPVRIIAGPAQQRANSSLGFLAGGTAGVGARSGIVGG